MRLLTIAVAVMLSGNVLAAQTYRSPESPDSLATIAAPAAQAADTIKAAIFAVVDNNLGEKYRTQRASG